MNNVVDLIAKTVAALVSIFTLSLTWKEMKDKMSKTQRNILQSPPVVATIVFGAAFSSNGSVRATILAILLVLGFVYSNEEGGDIFLPPGEEEEEASPQKNSRPTTSKLTWWQK